MLSVRVIPCLLLKNLGLYKGEKYDDQKYVGDPLNAIRIFNEKAVDELMIVDILATREGRSLDPEYVRKVATESLMPLSVGGGINDLEQAKALFGAGAEKVVINTAAFENPGLVEKIAGQFGSQSVIVSLDVRKLQREYVAYSRSGTKRLPGGVVPLAKSLEAAGAGEILLNAIDRAGTMSGYDVDITRSVSENVSIPVIASGGAGRLEDFTKVVREGGAAAVAAGAYFVFHGRRRAVLINFPSKDELERALGSVRP